MQDTKRRRTTGQITLFDVAKYAGVGTMTVSRALRTPECVSEKLRKKIQLAIDALGYKPNIAASLLASASTNRFIAIVTTKICDHSAKLFLDTLQASLTQENYILLVIESYHYNQCEQQLLDALFSHNLAAIILFYIENDNLIEQIISHKTIPIMNIGKHTNSLNNLDIAMNDSQAMYLLTEHVIKKGYEQIGLLCANQEYQFFQQRLHGWHKAMLTHHLPNHRIINAAKPANFTTGSEMLADMILNWPELEVIMCTTDELACGVLYECQRRHIKVPYQLAVCGFGDNEFSQVSFPPLTTISLPSKQLGKQTAQILLSQLTNNTLYSEPDLNTIIPIIKSRASLI